MSDITTRARVFLDQDYAKFQNPTFKPAEYIVEQLSEYNNNNVHYIFHCRQWS